MPQTKIVLACPECNSYNYVTSKNRRNVSQDLKLSKYCPKCREHTEHEETRLRK